jgi:hypothetical protein
MSKYVLPIIKLDDETEVEFRNKIEKYKLENKEIEKRNENNYKQYVRDNIKNEKCIAEWKKTVIKWRNRNPNWRNSANYKEEISFSNSDGIKSRQVDAKIGETYFVTAQSLNIRNEPTKSSKVIATLKLGDEVKLINNDIEMWWYVDNGIYKGFVYSQFLKEDVYSGWEKKNYESGATPECENVSPQYDYKLDNYLRINVGSGTDVVVKLMKKGYYDDECIRIVFVRSGDTYEIRNVPEGRYYLKIAYGKDYRKKIVDNTCYVKFMKNAQYEKGLEILDFNKIKQPNTSDGNDIYENWDVPSFELSLDVIVTKGTKSTFKANDISETEFNK